MTCAESCACEQISAQNRSIDAGESIPAHRLDEHPGTGQSILDAQRPPTGAGGREQPLASCDSPHPSILSEAESLVYGDRGRDYGPPDQDYGRAVAIYHAITGRHTIETAADGITFMVAVKLSRMAVSPHKRDHYVDLCGYADCLYRVVNEKNETEEVSG